MQVILLEHNQNLGNVGDLVKVKDGYARNYLLPKNKALRATAASQIEFEAKRAQIEKENLEKKKESEKSSSKIENQFFVLIRQAGEDGRLYGSVSARDISVAASEATSVEVNRSHVVQFSPIKNLGVHTVKVALHPEVVVNVNVIVARSAGEAEIAKKDFLAPKNKAEESEVEAVEVAEAEEGKNTKKSKKAKVESESEESAA